MTNARTWTAGALLAAAIGAGLGSACGGSTPQTTPGPANAAVTPVPGPQAKAPAALAEATNPAKTVAVQILAAKRVAPDTLRLELAVINKSGGQGTLDVAKALADTSGREAALDRLCVLSADGTRRIFVLRDAADKALLGGGLEPMQPAERRIVWALFPAPPSEATHLTVLLADLVFKDVPIS